VKVADLAAGVQLGGRFRLVELIGRGSYGDVWLAEVIDGSDLPPRVALKIYQQAQQSRATKVLLDEAETASGFLHAGLVRVFGAERIEGLVAMWMEYVDGESLFERLGPEESPRPVSLDDALRWLADVADALAYLHARKTPCVHGDLKLDNVLLDREGSARLVDFGQSRAIEDRFVQTEGTGALPYLAPEIMGRGTDGEGRRFVQSDIYAFGVIAYRLLTGRLPRRTPHEIFNLTPFPKPSELNPSVPEALENLVSRCLDKRPGLRFQTGAELLAGVEACRRSVSDSAQGGDALPTARPEPAPTLADELARVSRELVDEGRAREAVEKLEQAMQRRSTSPRLLLLYGAAARAAGKLEAAHLVYCRAIDWLKRNGGTDDDLRDPMEGRTELDVALKRYDDAADGYGWLAEHWPAKRWYAYRHGVALGLAGRYRESLGVLSALHDRGPASAMVCAKIGLAHLQLCDTERAVQYFGEALMLDEFEPVALFHMARLRAIEGRTDRAMGYLERLHRIDGAEQETAEIERLFGFGPARPSAPADSASGVAG